jgi:hypothetical protein
MKSIRMICTKDKEPSHTVAIHEGSLIIHKLDAKYLNLPTNLATTDDVQEAMNTANNAQTTADNAQTTADNKMNAKNPVGTGSFSMNIKSGTNIGSYSHAEGINATSSGTASHAEGSNTIASGDYSHAEGYYTVTDRAIQNVIGKYNVVDTALRYTDTHKPVSTTVISSKRHRYCGDYSYIVGNGTSDTARSNAHTLDWNGNAWYQGEVYVGGTGQDDATARLLKTSETATNDDILDTLFEMGYIDPISASDGSIYTNRNGEIYIL